MLAVSGWRIVMLSTPFGNRGFFYKEWSEGGAGICTRSGSRRATAPHF